MPVEYNVIEIFTSEDVRYQGKPLHDEIVRYVQGLKIAARCIVSRAIAGCFENGEIASQKILDISYNMPLKIEIILPAPELNRVLPGIETMVTDGIVVVEDMQIRSHRTSRHLIPKQLLVRDVMTPSPQSVSPQTPVRDIIHLLLSAAFHGVPVVDEGGRVRGIITQQDLITKGDMPVRLGMLARMERERVQEHVEHLPAKTAADIMTQPAVVMREDQPLTAAVAVMLQRQLKRLPVVDAEERLVGMLSRVDVFQTVTKEAPDFENLAAHHVEVTNVRLVQDIARRDTHTVRADAPLQQVIEIIDTDDIQRVAVVDADGRFLGLIFDHDLLTAFADHPLGVWDYLVSKLPFTEIGRRHRKFIEQVTARTAGEVMHRDVITVREDAPIDDAVKLMAEGGLKRLPVIDADGIFRGMISRDAVLRSGVGE